MILIYRFLLLLTYPFLKIYMAKRLRQGKEDKERISERFGFPTVTRPDGDVIWFHAVSVGESVSALRLVRLLATTNPEITILFTTCTITAAGVVQKRLADLPNVIHQFMPIDTTGAVKRFYEYWQPVCGMIMEEEFWPNLLILAKKYNCQLLSLNSKISKKSYLIWYFFKYTSVAPFRQFKAMFPQAKEYVERFSNLGNDRLRYLGNLKCDAEPLRYDESAVEKLQRQCAERPVILAASTHEGEEEILLQVTKELLPVYPKLLLLICPRHIERTAEIKQLALDAGLNCKTKQEDGDIQTDTQVYIYDVFGEMGNIYKSAKIVLMCGSLLPDIGGHNAAEAINLGCAVISGTNVSNWQQFYHGLASSEGCLLVNTPAELVITYREVFDNPKIISELNKNASRFISEELGATEKLYTEIVKLLS